jgi:hypothetical protein
MQKFRPEPRRRDVITRVENGFAGENAVLAEGHIHE